MVIENARVPFERPIPRRGIEGIKGVSQAVRTLFVCPPHEELHREVAERTKGKAQSLQPPIACLLNTIYSETPQYVDTTIKRKLKRREITHLDGVLMQFTDYMPALQEYAQTPYSHVDALYTEITHSASINQRPLTFVDQLHVALSLTEGDLTEAVWRLFITSRLYARWLDGSAIKGLPAFSQEEKIDRMMKWQNSLAACKPSINNSPQDTAGDTYYAWTHALAMIVYNELPSHVTPRIQLEKYIFSKGTRLMHNIVHRYNPQSVINDHSNAAEYGNAIGKACSDLISSSRKSISNASKQMAISAA